VLGDDASRGPRHVRIHKPLLVLVLCRAEFVTTFDFSIVTMSLAGLFLAVVAQPDKLFHPHGLGVRQSLGSRTFASTPRRTAN
jgi:hypothetical protein